MSDWLTSTLLDDERQTATRRLAARTLAYVYGILGGIGVFMFVTGSLAGRTAPSMLTLVAVAQLAAAVWLWRRKEMSLVAIEVSAWLQFAVAVLMNMGIPPDGAAGNLAFVWCVVYAAYLLPLRRATAPLLVSMVGYAAVLGFRDLQYAAMPQVAVTSLTAVALTVLISRARTRVELLLRRLVATSEDLASSTVRMARGNLQFALAMVRTLDARDSYTAGHSAAVAVYTADIARELGCDDVTCRTAHLAGLLHDVGKIGVRDDVLNKQGRLDDDERDLMNEHAAIGGRILSDVDAYSDLAIVVRHHHERHDGTGYPDQLAGEEIPAISRMISVADTYSAMTTDRPYREGMAPERAMAILAEAAGAGQLDPDFTLAFLSVLGRNDADYQRGRHQQFEVERARHETLGGGEAAVLARARGAADALAPVHHLSQPALDAGSATVDVRNAA